MNMTDQQVTQAVTGALSDLNPELVIDLSEPEWLRLQVISRNFEGRRFMERINAVLERLEEHCPVVCEERLIMVECFTPTCWAEMTQEERANIDPEEPNGLMDC